MSNRNRSWCFTLNNYTEEEHKNICNVECEYLIVGKEVGENGTPHLQGYIYFKNPRTMGGVKKLLGNKVHLEISRGSAKDNKIYCSKEGDFFEKGDMPQQGERTDLIEIKKNIEEGKKTVDEITMENPTIYHQYGRTLEKIEDIAMRNKFRDFTTTCTWYWGPTGTGKSHKAFENFNPETHYVLSTRDNGWWEDYKQQETVIINEFRGQIPYSFLLELCDKWPIKVPRRGRPPLPFLSKKIIITSSMHPKEVYKNIEEKDSIDQLLRRIDIIFLDKSAQKCTGGNTNPCAPLIKIFNTDDLSLIEDSDTE
jgi:hypothetical protein